jgi:glucose/arabinose dehydrogenase/fibronectin type 3 domain-containing protein
MRGVLSVRLRSAIAVICVIAGLLSFTGSASADTFSGSGFATETVATFPPFSLVGMAFAPDGRMFVWQKNGVVKIIKNGQVLSTPFIDLSSKVNTFDDRGFWGFAFDPNFSTNGYVYMTYTFESGGDPNSSAPRTSRLVRVQADPANPDRALPGSEQVILGSVGTPPCSAQPANADCIAADGGSHTIGSLRFSRDGTLFMGVGDGGEAGANDPNPLRAQDLTSPNGKILRIRTDGSAPSDNPFYDGTNSWRSRVWLYGVRNPFGFIQHPSLDEIYFGDVGWNTWEEIDHGGPGKNFGWPCFEGAGPQPIYQNNFAQCAALPASSVTGPFYTYDHSVGSTAIGGPFYTGTLYPQDYWGNFFFTDYAGNFIKRVVFDSQNRPVSVQPFATEVPAPVNLVLGADGMIYYLSFTTGELRRIRYNGPVADAAATPTFGYSPLNVNFSSAGSSNPGGGSLTYQWDFGDGTTSNVANPSHTYTSATVKTFAAKLTVTNSASLSSTDVVNVTVGSVPPTPTITAPADGTRVLPGQTVNFAGSATDAEDGNLTGTSLQWTVLLHHNTHVHTFVAGSGSSGSFVAEDHGPIGTFSYEIMLTATDSSGLQKSTSVNIPVGSDTSPPTDPTGLTANSAGLNQVNLNWSASTDNVTVGGYRVERCKGAGCTDFAEVASVSGTSYNDTSLLPGTLYRYRVRAVDPSSNFSGYSAIAQATTDSAPPNPPGLVGAWAFSEGTGTTTADATGNGNTGTLVGPTWSNTGRFGKALSFNGTNSLVRIANAASLNLGSRMTLSAWVQPTATMSGWRTIMQKEPDAYFLNASTSTPMRPAGGVALSTGSQPVVVGPTANPLNAWTYVALTYDGSALHLYVNGTEVATNSTTGTIQSTTGQLSIGGNTPYGEYFQGLIDEVRVYNRALTQNEVQGDMSTSITPTAPDGTPPSDPSGLTASTVSSSQVNLSWTGSTDNVGVANYRVERCLGASCTDFAEVGTPTGTTFNNTGLASSTTYRYRVRAADGAGNLSGYTTIATATTAAGSDTTAPSAPTALTATPVSTTQIDLAWAASTDNVGVTGYRVERCQGSNCTSWAQVGTPTANSFSNTGLAANTVYRFRVRAIDAAGNLSAYSTIVSARTLAADTTSPTAPSGLTAAAPNPNQVNLNWTASTDNVGVTGYRVERCQGASCTNWAEIGTTTTTAYSDTGRSPSTLYRYRVRAMDAAGNLSTYSGIATVTTPAVQDNTPPSDPTGLTASATGTQINLGWTASTDNVGVANYRVDRCVGSGCTNFAQIATPTGNSYSDTGLAASTTYRYRVRAVDGSNNLSGFSNIAEATTGTAPPTPSGLVGAWAFSEGAGMTTADLSGNGNTGTLVGPAWTATGHSGNALSFSGTSLVRVPNAASLNLGSAMTLSAWIRPTATMSGWRTIMQKEPDAYFLNASASTAMRPAGGATIGSGQPIVVGPVANPLNAWTHVALTYDGTQLRLFVNGQQVATNNASGPIQTSTGQLSIGGNTPYGEYFTGIIDDVRVYNRALSQSEIGTDMNSPLDLSGPGL